MEEGLYEFRGWGVVIHLTIEREKVAKKSALPPADGRDAFPSSRCMHQYRYCMQYKPDPANSVVQYRTVVQYRDVIKTTS